MSKMGRDNRTKWSIDKLFLFVTKKNSPSIFERTKCDLIKRRNDRSKSGTRYPRSAGAILSRNFIRQKQSGRRERRRPNPLRFAGRVFNFQDHQYVPRNPPAMLLQSLLPCSPLSLSLLSRSLLSFSLGRVPATNRLSSPSLSPSSSFPACFIDAAPSSRGMLCTSIISTNHPCQQVNVAAAILFASMFQRILILVGTTCFYANAEELLYFHILSTISRLEQFSY